MEEINIIARQVFDFHRIRYLISANIPRKGILLCFFMHAIIYASVSFCGTCVVTLPPLVLRFVPCQQLSVLLDIKLYFFLTLSSDRNYMFLIHISDDFFYYYLFGVGDDGILYKNNSLFSTSSVNKAVDSSNVERFIKLNM